MNKFANRPNASQAANERAASEFTPTQYQGFYVARCANENISPEGVSYNNAPTNRIG
jgi:hypothetical protein